MDFILLFFGIISGLVAYIIARCFLATHGYVKKLLDCNSDLPCICNVIIFCIGGAGIFIAFLNEFDPETNNSPYFYMGVVIGVILSILCVVYNIWISTYGKYTRIKNRIDKIKENIDTMRFGRITSKQSQAIKLLSNTQEKLEEQAYNILIMDSIKIAKNIELSNDGIDIQRELDELEALQILNKE